MTPLELIPAAPSRILPMFPVMGRGGGGPGNAVTGCAGVEAPLPNDPGVVDVPPPNPDPVLDSVASCESDPKKWLSSKIAPTVSPTPTAILAVASERSEALTEGCVGKRRWGGATAVGAAALLGGGAGIGAGGRAARDGLGASANERSGMAAA